MLFVTIEMRHAPFIGWINDLSASDPFGIMLGHTQTPALYHHGSLYFTPA